MTQQLNEDSQSPNNLIDEITKDAFYQGTSNPQKQQSTFNFKDLLSNDSEMPIDQKDVNPDNLSDEFKKFEQNLLHDSQEHIAEAINGDDQELDEMDQFLKIESQVDEFVAFNDQEHQSSHEEVTEVIQSVGIKVQPDQTE